MRAMSFMHTEQQILNRTKTETRRRGWRFLRPGDRLLAVRKAQGLKKGEKYHRLAVIEVVSVTLKCLDRITQKSVIAEGFPDMTPKQFVEMFCREMKCDPSQLVNVIKFKYVEDGESDQ